MNARPEDQRLAVRAPVLSGAAGLVGDALQVSVAVELQDLGELARSFVHPLPALLRGRLSAGGQHLCGGRGHRLLVVDDNKTNRLVMRELLASVGHNVDLANSGKDAVNISASKKYDCIFMDISMPEMDGIEATQLIRERASPNRVTPIIALTAHAIAGDRERFLAAGMNDYLTKPVRLSDLETRLSTLNA